MQHLLQYGADLGPHVINKNTAVINSRSGIIEGVTNERKTSIKSTLDVFPKVSWPK